MSLLTEREVRAASQLVTRRTFKAAATVLSEAAANLRTHYDVFLSHSKLDAELVLGVKSILEATGESVYVDWLDDPHMDRSQVSARTAQVLRQRMRQSDSLFYAHSSNATKSRWMPWELGYFDGYSGNVAILPIVEAPDQLHYKGEEYLGLYPYVDLTGRTVTSPGRLYIHRNAGTYMDLERWRASSDKLRPAA